MRLLLLSDIHSNIDALEACLAAAPEYDSVANLGDVVGYGGAPNEVVDRIRPIAEICVRGNHDRACSGASDTSDFNPIASAAARWTYERLTESNRAWVRDLPRGPIVDSEYEGVQFVHGSPLDEDEYIMSSAIAEVSILSSPFRLTFFGHTHVQGGFGVKGRETLRLAFNHGHRDEKSTHRIMLDANGCYIVNPGSVGQPRDGDPRSGFAVYDSDEHSIEFYRVPYDIPMAQQRIVSAGLPLRLASRLAEGR